MEPRTNPSGGDWALERQGALLLEGCVGCVIKGNSFHHLDTNAVFLSVSQPTCPSVHDDSHSRPLKGV